MGPCPDTGLPRGLLVWLRNRQHAVHRAQHPNDPSSVSIDPPVPFSSLGAAGEAGVEEARAANEGVDAIVRRQFRCAPGALARMYRRKKNTIHKEK